MKIAIMQPYFFPYIGYFQLINSVDKFVIYDDVNFIKKGWINRNNILVNKKSYLFSIPLQNASQNKTINDINISDLDQWKITFLKTINSSYKKAPFYNDVFPIIEKIINFKQLNLASYIQFSIQSLCDYLKIKTQIKISSEIIKNNEFKGENKIIDICIQMNATEYINPIGGIELYNKKNFINNNIELYFIKSENIVYDQFKNEFISSLSIIDIMMFNHPDKINNMLDQFVLV